VSESELSRRALLSAGALAAGAGVALTAAGTAGADVPEEPTLPRSKHSNRYGLADKPPDKVRQYGTIALCDGKRFPVLQDNAGSAALIRLKRHGLREPHWHPNGWEMQIPLSGTGTLGVVNPDGTWSTQELGPGDIGFVPQGFAHYTENTGTEPLAWMLVFNVTEVTTIDLSIQFQGLPTHAFTEPLGLPPNGLAQAKKGTEDVVITGPA
jgi:oxalate decarboxylase